MAIFRALDRGKAAKMAGKRLAQASSVRPLRALSPQVGRVVQPPELLSDRWLVLQAPTVPNEISLFSPLHIKSPQLPHYPRHPCYYNRHGHFPKTDDNNFRRDAAYDFNACRYPVLPISCRFGGWNWGRHRMRSQYVDTDRTLV